MYPNRAMRLARISLLFALLAAGCSLQQARNNQLLKQWAAKCGEAADLLKTVQDVPSAKAAGPKLKVVLEELNRINGLLEESDDSEDVDLLSQRSTVEHVGQGIAEMQRLMEESLRIGKNRELREALGESWELLPAAALLDEEGNPKPGS